jgi:hypothetical protein
MYFVPPIISKVAGASKIIWMAGSAAAGNYFHLMSASKTHARSAKSARLWPLLALNFFMADMQSGIGPFVGVFLQSHGWASGLIGTATTLGNVAGMLITTPIGGLIDTTNYKRSWVIVVTVVNQIRTYWWCSPPRTGRQRMVPASLTARETGASFSKDKCVLI